MVASIRSPMAALCTRRARDDVHQWQEQHLVCGQLDVGQYARDGVCEWHCGSVPVGRGI